MPFCISQFPLPKLFTESVFLWLGLRVQRRAGSTLPQNSHHQHLQLLSWPLHASNFCTQMILETLPFGEHFSTCEGLWCCVISKGVSGCLVSPKLSGCSLASHQVPTALSSTISEAIQKLAVVYTSSFCLLFLDAFYMKGRDLLTWKCIEAFLRFLLIPIVSRCELFQFFLQ